MKRWLGIGVPFLIVLCLVGWRISAEKAEAAKLKGQQKGRSGQTPVVEVATAERRPILQAIEVVGTVEAPISVKLSPKVAGRIAFLEVREGDAVVPGQTLVRIDPREIDAQVLQQRAAIAEARSRLAQAEMTAGANQTRVESAVKVQRAALDSARADLRQTEKNHDAYIGTAEAAVTDAEARLSAAESEVVQRKADLKAADAARRNARARLDRLSAQLDKGFVSQQQVDDARLAYESADAMVGVRQGEIASAESQVRSAKALLTSAEKQLAIAKEKSQADMAAARARVRQAEALSEEAGANRAQTPAYRQNLLALRANVAAAEAGLRQMEARQLDLELKSTVEGTVTERLADPGSLASPGQTLVTVQFLKWVFVSATVPVEHAAKVYRGQPVQIRVDAFANRTFSGSIQQISQSADPQSRQFVVKIRLENASGELRPGMFARVELVTSKVEAPAVVPVAAVAKGPDGESVTVIDDKDAATKRPVKTGAADRNGIAILQGLKPGERVVTLSYAPVRDGQKVQVGAKP